MPEKIHQFPTPPLPRQNQDKSSASMATPKVVNTYGSKFRSPVSHAAGYVRPAGDSDDAASTAVPGSSPSGTRAERARSSSSNLTSPPESSSAPRRVHVDEEEEEGEESMDFDAGEEEEDEQEVEEESNGRRGSIGGRSDGYSTDPGGNLASDYSDDEDMEVKVVLHVEVRRTPLRMGSHSEHTLKKMLREYIQQMDSHQAVGSDLDIQEWGSDSILKNVNKVLFAECEPASERFNPSEVDLRFHFYHPSTYTDLEQFTAVTEDEDEADAVPAASVRDLPSMELEGIWENLIYSTDLKPRLLRYINSTMAFSDARVDFNKVSWNRLVLLHGPPGTGKTSLCRALAQKLLVRMSGTYSSGKLVEINSHSLFSKWFSESGKLVQKLFSRVTEMVDDQQCLVVVMIDEVESLTAARSAAINGSEPSDALRVVNALLTQLDKLKTKQNVLVLTTSNIPDTIDSAFIDRADEKFFVDYPPPEAVYWILKGCLLELGEKGMMRHCGLPMVEDVKVLQANRRKEILLGQRQSEAKSGRLHGTAREIEAGIALLDIANTCYKANLAGRFLRRLPLLAHSHYLSVTTKIDEDGQPKARTIEKWLEAFAMVVKDEIGDRARIAQKTHTTLANGTTKEGGD